MKGLILVTSFILLAGMSPLLAQSNCVTDHTTVMETLADKYGEVRIHIAIGSDGSIVEQYANVETGTWTITVTAPNGPVCLVASGEDFYFTNETLPYNDEQL